MQLFIQPAMSWRGVRWKFGRIFPTHRQDSHPQVIKFTASNQRHRLLHVHLHTITGPYCVQGQICGLYKRSSNHSRLAKQLQTGVSSTCSDIFAVSDLCCHSRSLRIIPSFPVASTVYRYSQSILWPFLDKCNDREPSRFPPQI